MDHPATAPALVWTAPFAILLLCIAALPLIPAAAHWWEHNRSKLLVGLILGAIVLLYYVSRPEGYHHANPGIESARAVLSHAILDEYVPFMVLLFTLYVIAGGVRLTGDLKATPWVNTCFLAAGATAASFVGTTGASMVLIRPLLQTNRERVKARHTVVFFIFLVSNVGGALLPIGDPPLFLGYLRGVPFLWTLKLFLPWLATTGMILAVYFVWDSVAYRGEAPAQLARDQTNIEPLKLRGKINLLWLAAAVFATALAVPGRPLPGTSFLVPNYSREGVLLGLTGLSLLSTPRGIRQANEFTYTPILEVAALFLGIFITMQPPIEILQTRGPELGIDGPDAFFWSTGGLSSLLDNAPTYLVFLETAKTLPPLAGSELVMLHEGAVDAARLAAISLGAVFLGAMTYIGNGPNLMVKSIAEQSNIPMPSFFGYAAYSAVVLLPIFYIMTRLFL